MERAEAYRLHIECAFRQPVARAYGSSVNAIAEPDRQVAQIFNDGGDAILFAERIEARGLI